MPEPRPLPADPVEEAGRHWQARWPAADAMVTATSIMRVQQLLLARIDGVLRDYDLTFARYEALVLLTFSRRGSLPMSRMGRLLMIHPTSVTNIVNRLELQDFVRRVPHPSDGRTTLVEITESGRKVTEEATKALTDERFGLGGVGRDQLKSLYDLLTDVRVATADLAVDAARVAPGFFDEAEGADTRTSE
jgi:DNA-binding MarR family transcriptional regulator